MAPLVSRIQSRRQYGATTNRIQTLTARRKIYDEAKYPCTQMKTHYQNRA